MKPATLIVQVDSVDHIIQRYGFEAGQELIWNAAWRIVEVMDADGVVGALGRGKFRISLYRHVDESEVDAMCARLHGALRAPFDIGTKNREVFVSASIGVAVGSPTDSADMIVDQAEQAVHRVQASGGDATFVLRERHRVPVARAS